MNLTQAILATVYYHDIFNYPLTQKEILSYLVSKKTDQKALTSELGKMARSHRLQVQGGYYFLKNRKRIVNLRKNRTKYSASKLKKVKIFAGLLKMIPVVQFVGISGALSMGNSTKFDDIDLVIITAKKRLWTTRFLANVLLFPVKRKPGSKKTHDRACLNLFLDESDLRIYDENIYQAHEICQLKPIWQRNNAYSRLIKANSWVKKYLPNWQMPSVNNQQLVSPEGGSTINNLSSEASAKEDQQSTINNLLGWIETIIKKLQLSYMRSRITTEQIRDSQLFFHPGDTQERVLKEYQKRLKRLKIIDKDI